MSKITEHDVEQRSDEWFDLRKGRIGGSEAHRITTLAKMKTVVTEKIEEILIPSDNDEVFSGEAAEYGIEHEGEASFAFELETGLTTTEIGYVTNSRYKYAGLSPDRSFSDSGRLEIKCPQPKAHINMIISGKPEPNYMNQILWYFMVDDRVETVYFMSYCPMIKGKEILLIEYKRASLVEDIKKMDTYYLKFEKTLESSLKLFK